MESGRMTASEILAQCHSCSDLRAMLEISNHKLALAYKVVEAAIPLLEFIEATPIEKRTIPGTLYYYARDIRAALKSAGEGEGK